MYKKCTTVVTPFTFIDMAIGRALTGDFQTALNYLEDASVFAGTYYEEGSEVDNDFKESIELLKNIITLYPDKMREIICRNELQ